ncbi:MAG TPA: glucose-1-phosphate adenylyltransferase [Nitrospirota bacterium]|nr:glucose-1-phosphate adenylyltransferase [Nitrospirota bacterium]
MAHPKVLAFVLAGGKGERLAPLTDLRSKPSVPFGGRFRIADFVLSNLVNSHIYSVYLLVQYKSQSLIEHVRQNWVLSPVIRDHFVAVVPPQMRMGPEWFQGTADAVYQNVNLIEDQDPELVIVFGADHIYRMDIRQMIDFHLEKGAEVTLAARPVPIGQAADFGVILTDRERRITGFQEKPERPAPMPDDPGRSYVSMGNYIFNRDVLVDSLVKAQKEGRHDFGAHIIPSLVGPGRVYAYDFATNIIPDAKSYEEKGYWRDVGTIPSFYQAHMDMLGRTPLLDLHNRSWPIQPAGYKGPAATILRGEIQNSIISEGVLVEDARIVNSVIRRDVVIEDGAVVENSIIMDHTIVGKGCRLKGVIADKFNVFTEGLVLGDDVEKDRLYSGIHIDPSGIRIIPKAGRTAGQGR